MTPVISGVLLVGIFFFSLLKGMDYALRAATALLPFGASAVLLLGGQSVLSVSFCFLILLGLWFVTSAAHMNKQIKLEFASFLIFALGLYAFLITMIGPRLFAGDIMVFSLDRNVVGYRLRHDIPSGLSLLVPTRGNISQLIYFLITCFVFVSALSLARRNGPKLIHKALIGAGIVNIVLASLDMVGGDAILSLFQTANYGYLTDVQVLGRERITGGFPEASSFGGFSAILAGYFIRLYLSTRDIKIGLLGLGNFTFGLLSVSSTFIVTTVVVLTFLFAQLLIYLARGQGISSRTKPFILLFMLGLSMMVMLFIITPLGNLFFSFFDYLIFNKTTSLSGYERGQWALRGLEIGRESYGFGIGLGSTRSNGIFSVWVSNFGFIGTFIFLYLYKTLLLSKPFAFATHEDKYFFNAACVGLVAHFAGALISATTPDPGLLFALMAALSVASRKPVLMTYGKTQFLEGRRGAYDLS